MPFVVFINDVLLLITHDPGLRKRAAYVSYDDKSVNIGNCFDRFRTKITCKVTVPLQIYVPTLQPA